MCRLTIESGPRYESSLKLMSCWTLALVLKAPGVEVGKIYTAGDS